MVQVAQQTRGLRERLERRVVRDRRGVHVTRAASDRNGADGRRVGAAQYIVGDVWQEAVGRRGRTAHRFPHQLRVRSQRHRPALHSVHVYRLVLVSVVPSVR